VEPDALPEAPVRTMPQVRDLVASAVIRHDPKAPTTGTWPPADRLASSTDRAPGTGSLSGSAIPDAKPERMLVRRRWQGQLEANAIVRHLILPIDVIHAAAAAAWFCYRSRPRS